MSKLSFIRRNLGELNADQINRLHLEIVEALSPSKCPKCSGETYVTTDDVTHCSSCNWNKPLEA